MKIKICVEPDCKNAQSTKDYCRLHYLKNWKKIKDGEQKKAVDRLNRYVDGICKKNPDRYAQVVRRELNEGKGDLMDESLSGDSQEAGFDALGFHDDQGVDKLLSRLKVDQS